MANHNTVKLLNTVNTVKTSVLPWLTNMEGGQGYKVKNWLLIQYPVDAGPHRLIGLPNNIHN